MTPALISYLTPRYRLIYRDPWGGRVLIRNDLADGNLAVLARATGAFPECWEAQLNLGDQLRQSGRDREAVRAYGRALSSLPDDPGFASLRKQLAVLARGEQ